MIIAAYHGDTTRGHHPSLQPSNGPALYRSMWRRFLASTDRVGYGRVVHLAPRGHEALAPEVFYVDVDADRTMLARETAILRYLEQADGDVLFCEPDQEFHARIPELGAESDVALLLRAGDESTMSWRIMRQSALAFQADIVARMEAMRPKDQTWHGDVHAFEAIRKEGFPCRVEWRDAAPYGFDHPGALMSNFKGGRKKLKAARGW